jgi:23S rRNA-/tRNA-specific pseudouridylate synthase
MAVVRGVSETARPAITEYRTRESFKQFTLLEVEPKTGRTHQIRVHLLFLKCPLAGDTLYVTRQSAGVKLPGLHRQFLHAARLSLQLPSGPTRTFESPLPSDLSSALNELRQSRL